MKLLTTLLKRLGLSEKEASAPMTELDRMHAALRVSVQSILKAALPPEEEKAMLAETNRQFLAAVGSLSKTPPVSKGTEDDLAEDADDDDDDDAATKRLTPEEAIMEKAEQEKLEKAVADATATITKLSAQVETVVAENVALRKQVTDADAREQERELIKQAEALVATTDVPLATVLPLVRKAHGDKDAMAAVESIVKSLKAAQSDAELFKTIGRSGPSEPTSAEVELAKRAEALMTADPKLTRPVAVDKVLTTDPKLYDRIEAEKRKQTA